MKINIHNRSRHFHLKMLKVSARLHIWRLRISTLIRQAPRLFNPKNFVYVGRYTVLLTVALLIFSLFSTPRAGAANAILAPDGDVTTQWANTGGSSDSSCAGGAHCDFVDEGTSPIFYPEIDYIATGATGTSAADAMEEFTMTTASNIDTATQLSIKITARSATNANGGTLDAIDVNIRINGTLQTAQQITPSYTTATTWNTYTVNFNGSWSQSDIDSLQVHLTRVTLGGGNPTNQRDDVQVATVYADMTYSQTTLMDQSSYRWFGNQDASNGLSFIKAYGASTDEEGRGITETPDGGFVVVGVATFVNNDALIAKFDLNGNLVWQKTNTSASNTQLDDVIIASDGNYVAVGNDSAGGSGSIDQLIVKYDTDGDIVWEKAWGGSGEDYAYSVVETSDGGYAVAGESNSFSGGGDKDQTLVKYNSSGVEQWSKTWGGTNDDIGNELIESSDGSLVVVGRYGVGSFIFDQSIVKYSSSGVRQWSKTWHYDEFESAESVLQDAGGNYVVAGYTGTLSGDQDITIVKYNSSGTEQWSKTWDRASRDNAYSIVLDGDGGYIVAANGNGTAESLLIKFNSSGTEQWSKSFNGSGNDTASDVLITSDGGYAITGLTSSYGSGGKDMLLIKYDSSGQILNCTTDCSDLTMAETNLSMTESNLSTSEVNQTVTETSPSYTETGSSLSTTVIASATLANVSAALAAQDTVATAPAEGTPFRLRTTGHVSIAELSAGAGSFKLQYAQKTGATCDTNMATTDESYEDIIVESSGSEGYNNAASATNNTSAGTIAWNQPGNVLADDTSYASVTTSAPGEYSNYIQVSGLGFSIPAEAEIDGVAVQVRGTSTKTQYVTHTGAVYLQRNGTILGLGKSITLSNTETLDTAGSESQLWSASLTPSIVNGSDFGAFFRVQHSGSDFLEPDATTDIDHITVSVYYTIPATEISYADNTNAVSGMGVASSVDDPVHSGHTNTYQSYVEENNFSNTYAIASGADGVWDFALVDNGAPADTNYCFRIVYSTGGLLNSYISVPEIKTASPVFTQADYRWFENQDSVSVGSALAAQNTPIEALNRIGEIRLRSIVNISDKDVGSQSLKLQYASKSGICDVNFIGEVYKDVPSGGSASAQASGTLAASADGGTASWSNVTDALSSDNTRANTSTVASFGVYNSQQLQISGFGFAIPLEATIDGVEVSVEGYKTTSQARITSQVSLLGVAASKKGYIANEGEVNEDIKIYGSSSDLWAATITPSDVNSSSFGATLEITNMIDDSGIGDGFASLYADHIQMTVYYSTPLAGELVAFQDNASAADGAGYSVSVDDPSNATTSIAQSYVESNAFSATSITKGESGIWDFSLQTGVDLGGSYCFRIVKSDGSLLDNYTYIPELSTPPRNHQFMRHGRWFGAGQQGRPFYW